MIAYNTRTQEAEGDMEHRISFRAFSKEPILAWHTLTSDILVPRLTDNKFLVFKKIHCAT